MLKKLSPMFHQIGSFIMRKNKKNLPVDMSRGKKTQGFCQSIVCGSNSTHLVLNTSAT